MNCSNCNNALPNGAQACPACGAPVTAAPGTPGQNNAPQNWPQPAQNAPQAYGQQGAPSGWAQPGSQPGPAYAPQQAAPQQGGWAPPAQPGAPAEPGAAYGQQAYSPPLAPQAYGQQPAYATAGGALVPVKKKRGGLIALFIALGVLLIAGAGVLLYFFVFTGGGGAIDPVRNAYTKTMNTLSQEYAATQEQLGVVAALGQLAEGPAETNISFSTAIPGMPGNITVSNSMRTDPSQGKMNMDLALGFSGAALLEGTLLMDGDTVSATSPTLFAGEYGADLAQLLPMLAAPARMVGLPTNLDISAALADGLIEAETSNAITALFSAMLDGAGVESAGTQSTQVNGITRACEVYELNLPEEAWTGFLLDSYDALLNDEALMDMLVQAVNSSRSSLGAFGASFGQTMQGLDGYLDPMGQDELQQQLREGREEIQDLLESSIGGDITGTAYLQDGNLVKLNISVGELEPVDFTLEIGGEYNLSDAISFTVDTRFGSFTLSAKGAQVPVDGVYSMTYAVQVSEANYGTSVSASLDVYWDTNQSSDNFTLYFQTSNGFWMDASGSLNADGAAKTLSMQLDEVYVSDGYNAFSFGLGCELAPASADAVRSPDPDMYLDQMSDEELAALMLEIQSNLGALGSLFGTAGY